MAKILACVIFSAFLFSFWPLPRLPNNKGRQRQAREREKGREMQVFGLILLDFLLNCMCHLFRIGLDWTGLDLD